MTALDHRPHTQHLLTLAEWDALGETEDRLECIEGVLFVAASPRVLHQRVAARIEDALDRQLPPELAVLHDVDVLLVESPLTIRCPDVAVTTEAVVATNPARLTGTQVELVVEVISEGTARMDRVMKMSEYAEAGIPTYWIVDLDPLRLTAFALRGHAYQQVGEFAANADLTVAGHPVRLDPSGLTTR